MAAVYAAFLAHRTWRQPELAARVGVQVEALRRVLEDLEAAGMPLSKDKEGTQVFWSVPKKWFPGGVLVGRDTAANLVREIWRLPPTAPRKKLIGELLAGFPQSDAVHGPGELVLTPSVSDQEAAYLSVAEDSQAKRVPLRVRYYSMHSGMLSWRHVSVQLVAPNPPARMVGLCHRSNELRWFRIDGITEGALDPATPFRAATKEAVAQFVTDSADGFHEPEAPETHVFVVRDPEARWVEKNLFAPLQAERVVEGVRVTARTAGALRIARMVVSLGSAARAETSDLRKLVEELARGAVEGATAPMRTKKAGERKETGVNERAVSSIRRRR